MLHSRRAPGQLTSTLLHLHQYTTPVHLRLRLHLHLPLHLHLHPQLIWSAISPTLASQSPYKSTTMYLIVLVNLWQRDSIWNLCDITCTKVVCSLLRRCVKYATCIRYLLYYFFPLAENLIISPNISAEVYDSRRNMGSINIYHSTSKLSNHKVIARLTADEAEDLKRPLYKKVSKRNRYLYAVLLASNLLPKPYVYMCMLWTTFIIS